MVIQFNKRDLPGIMSVEELNARLNTKGRPHFEASATVGNGVFDTLKLIIKLVLEKAKNNANSRPKPTVSFAASQEESEQMPEPERAPYPEPSREPVRQPSAVSTETATMTEPVREEEPSPELEPVAVESQQPEFRPYPGSGGRASENVSVQGSSIKPVTAPRASGPSISEHGERMGQLLSPKQAPTMAPSVKRRADKERKRGFFKRIFGIK